MRTRVINGPNCPVIPTYDYAWDTTVTPYRNGVTKSSHETVSSFGSYWMLPNGYKTRQENMQDETGDDGTFRNCHHTFESNEFAAPLYTIRFGSGCLSNAYVRGFGPSHIQAVRDLRTPPNIDMDAYAAQALAFMLPRLNEGTSLVNSILELKDLKRMNPTGSVKRIRDRRLAIKHLSNPKARKAFIKETVTRLNNAHLNASFGISPLIADVVGIHDDLVSLAARLEALKKNAGKRLERHYKRVIPEAPGLFSKNAWVTRENQQVSSWETLSADGWPGQGLSRPSPLTHYRARWVKRPVYHATMRYIYTLPEMDSQLEKVYAHLDTLGVRLDPSIVWNAIPFSFVVDWVVDVSGFLGSFARDNYPITVNLLEFCHSYSWHREQEIYVSCPRLTYLDANPNYNGRKPPYEDSTRVKIYRGSNTHYSRVRASPDIHSARLKAPKLRQAALAGSLLLARTSWGNRKRYLTSDAILLRRGRVTR